jgi:hypothetical protein
MHEQWRRNAVASTNCQGVHSFAEQRAICVKINEIQGVGHGEWDLAPAWRRALWPEISYRQPLWLEFGFEPPNHPLSKYSENGFWRSDFNVFSRGSTAILEIPERHGSCTDTALQYSIFAILCTNSDGPKYSFVLYHGSNCLGKFGADLQENGESDYISASLWLVRFAVAFRSSDSDPIPKPVTINEIDRWPDSFSWANRVAIVTRSYRNDRTSLDIASSDLNVEGLTTDVVRLTILL